MYCLLGLRPQPSLHPGIASRSGTTDGVAHGALLPPKAAAMDGVDPLPPLPSCLEAMALRRLALLAVHGATVRPLLARPRR